MKKQVLKLSRLLVGGLFCLAGLNPAHAQTSGPAKRFATFPVESMNWCNATADEFRQRVPDSKVTKAFAIPNQLSIITAYWIDTSDNASIALICFDNTALVLGQKNPRPTRRAPYGVDVSRYGPKCRHPERGEIFRQDKDHTIFWTRDINSDAITICIPGVTSIELSRYWS